MVRVQRGIGVKTEIVQAVRSDIPDLFNAFMFQFFVDKKRGQVFNAAGCQFDHLLVIVQAVP